MNGQTAGDKFCAFVYGPASLVFMYLFAIATLVMFLIKSPLVIVTFILTGLNLYQYKVAGAEYRREQEALLKVPEKKVKA